MGEGAVFGLQGAALRVVVEKPAKARFQGAGGNGFPLGVHPGGLLVTPVPYEDPPSLNCKGKEIMRPSPGAEARSVNEDNYL